MRTEPPPLLMMTDQIRRMIPKVASRPSFESIPKMGLSKVVIQDGLRRLRLEFLKWIKGPKQQLFLAVQSVSEDSDPKQRR